MTRPPCTQAPDLWFSPTTGQTSTERKRFAALIAPSKPCASPKHSHTGPHTAFGADSAQTNATGSDKPPHDHDKRAAGLSAVLPGTLPPLRLPPTTTNPRHQLPTEGEMTMTDERLAELRAKLDDGERHYRVGPARCVCGFDAYKINGIMVDYAAHYDLHRRRYQDRKPGTVTPPEARELLAEVVRLRVQVAAVEQVIGQCQHLGSCQMGTGERCYRTFDGAVLGEAIRAALTQDDAA